MVDLIVVGDKEEMIGFRWVDRKEGRGGDGCLDTVLRKKRMKNSCWFLPTMLLFVVGMRWRREGVRERRREVKG